MKILIPTIILILLTGCKQRTLNYVSYRYAECESVGNVGIKLDDDGVHRCIEPNTRVLKVFEKKRIVIKKNKSKSNECETTVTEIYTSKASGEITICKGKLLGPGQKTRIIRVEK